MELWGLTDLCWGWPLPHVRSPPRTGAGGHVPWPGSCRRRTLRTVGLNRRAGAVADEPLESREGCIGEFGVWGACWTTGELSGRLERLGIWSHGAQWNLKSRDKDAPLVLAVGDTGDFSPWSGWELAGSGAGGG